jgi:hypothetical protein
VLALPPEAEPPDPEPPDPEPLELPEPEPLEPPELVPPEEPPAALEPPEPLDPLDPVALEPPVVAFEVDGFELLPLPQAESASAAAQTAASGSARRSLCKAGIQQLVIITSLLS